MSSSAEGGAPLQGVIEEDARRDVYLVRLRKGNLVEANRESLEVDSAARAWGWKEPLGKHRPAAAFGKPPYMPQEDESILAFVTAQAGLLPEMSLALSGNKLWQEADVHQVCPGRTWESTKERFKKFLALKYNNQANKGCRRQSVPNVPAADHGEETRKEEQEAVGEGIGDGVASADGKLEAVKLEAVKLEAVKLEAVKLEAVRLEAIKLEAGAIKPVVKLEAVKLEAGAIEPVVKRGRQARGQFHGACHQARGRRQEGR